MSTSESEKGGFKEIVFEVHGRGAYSRLKFESGGHRVQRVPTTEASGRVHTSTSTVVVLPEAEEVEVDIDEKDLRIDIYHSGGAGGQNVNKVATAVRITHLPTNIVVQCQDERSQLKNRIKAMSVLRARLLQVKERAQAAEISDSRKSQAGTGERAEKIRTYNFSPGSHNRPPSWVYETRNVDLSRWRHRRCGRRGGHRRSGPATRGSAGVNLREALSSARDQLQAAGIFNADLEAEALLRHVLALDRTALLQRLADPLRGPSETEYPSSNSAAAKQRNQPLTLSDIVSFTHSTLK